MDRIVLFLFLFNFSLLSMARDPLPAESIGDVLTDFQYESQYTIVDDNENSSSWSSCWTYNRVIETTFPNMQEPLDVNLQMYVPNRKSLGDEEVPVVFILPPVGGANFLDRNMAETFCDNKIAAIIISNDFANIDSQSNGSLLPPEDHGQALHRAVAGVKATMAMVTDDLNLNQKKMGIFGASLGGILGSFAMTTQKEIAAGYFIVAGGDIPNILAHSQQEDVARIRRKRMAAENIETKEEYETYIRNYVTLDPIDLGLTMLPETIKMVISKRDDAVPTENQYNLHQAFGEPEADYSNDGHVDTVVGSLLFGNSRRRIANFFKDRFKVDNPRPAIFEFLNSLAIYQN